MKLISDLIIKATRGSKAPNNSGDRKRTKGVRSAKKANRNKTPISADAFLSAKDVYINNHEKLSHHLMKLNNVTGSKADEISKYLHVINDNTNRILKIANR